MLLYGKKRKNLLSRLLQLNQRIAQLSFDYFVSYRLIFVSLVDNETL